MWGEKAVKGFACGVVDGGNDEVVGVGDVLWWSQSGVVL